MPEPRRLILDIETFPNLAYVWGLWKQDISIDKIVRATEMACWAAKWYHEKKIFFSSLFTDDKMGMLEGIKTLLNQADAVIHYNGKSFDMPIIRTEMLLKNMAPPSSPKDIDLYETVRSRFRLPSNKLEYVSKMLGFGGKRPHEGFDMWVKCMDMDRKAWQEMMKYNIRDVDLTEKAYDKLRPWMDNHPYLYDNGLCPKCGSDKVTRQGSRVAIKYKYVRLKCESCGGWFMGDRIK